jgi:hypothetical protein
MPAKSKSQQRLFGMIHACQKSGKCASEKIQQLAQNISYKNANDFARTKHKKLPERKLSFKEWLLSESQTVAQFLRTKTNAGVIKQAVTQFVQERTVDVSPKALPILINWLTKELIVSGTQAVAINGFLENMWQEIGDYLIAQLKNNQFVSKLNTMELTYSDMVENAHSWHAQLKNDSKNKQGAIGTTIIDLNDIGWKGWKWVNLNKRYCKQEGDAMGHCGNVAGKLDDSILSLRDPQNTPKLTFIVNKGVLGETKGAGNSKPSAKYHPAIIELLKSDYVKMIGGGGYMPDNNFQFKDLPENLQKEILTIKPNINDIVKKRIEEYDYLKEKLSNGINEDVIRFINNQFKRPVIKIDLHGEEYAIDIGLDIKAHHNADKLYDSFVGFIKNDHSHELEVIKNYGYNQDKIASTLSSSYVYDLKTHRIKFDDVKFSSLFLFCSFLFSKLTRFIHSCRLVKRLEPMGNVLF